MIEGSKLKLNLDIFNTINPPQKTFLEKKNNEQSQTQPVFQNKLTSDLNNKIGVGVGGTMKTNQNQTPIDKPAKFFDEKSNNIDLKARNLTNEINALDKILLTKDANNKNPINNNNEGNYLSKLKNSDNMPVLSNAGKGKNKILEIKNDDNADAYLQMKLNTVSTAKARKILPNQNQEKKSIEQKDRNPNLLTKTKENQTKNTINDVPSQINQINDKTINMKANTNNSNNNQSNNLQINKNNTKIDEKIGMNQKNIATPNDEKLYECPDCGRKFNEKALEKHVKVCKKVFQSKPQKQEKKQKEDKPEEKNTTSNKKAKWQKQSEAFRAVVKAAKNQFDEKTENQKKDVPKKEATKKTKK